MALLTEAMEVCLEILQHRSLDDASFPVISTVCHFLKDKPLKDNGILQKTIESLQRLNGDDESRDDYATAKVTLGKLEAEYQGFQTKMQQFRDKFPDNIPQNFMHVPSILSLEYDDIAWRCLLACGIPDLALKELQQKEQELNQQKVIVQHLESKQAKLPPSALEFLEKCRLKSTSPIATTNAQEESLMDPIPDKSIGQLYRDLIEAVRTEILEFKDTNMVRQDLEWLKKSDPKFDDFIQILKTELEQLRKSQDRSLKKMKSVGEERQRLEDIKKRLEPLSPTPDVGHDIYFARILKVEDYKERLASLEMTLETNGQQWKMTSTSIRDQVTKWVDEKLEALQSNFDSCCNKHSTISQRISQFLKVVKDVGILELLNLPMESMPKNVPPKFVGISFKKKSVSKRQDSSSGDSRPNTPNRLANDSPVKVVNAVVNVEKSVARSVAQDLSKVLPKESPSEVEPVSTTQPLEPSQPIENTIHPTIQKTIHPTIEAIVQPSEQPLGTSPVSASTSASTTKKPFKIRIPNSDTKVRQFEVKSDVRQVERLPTPPSISPTSTVAAEPIPDQVLTPVEIIPEESQEQIPIQQVVPTMNVVLQSTVSSSNVSASIVSASNVPASNVPPSTSHPSTIPIEQESFRVTSSNGKIVIDLTTPPTSPGKEQSLSPEKSDQSNGAATLVREGSRDSRSGSVREKTPLMRDIKRESTPLSPSKSGKHRLEDNGGLDDLIGPQSKRQRKPVNRYGKFEDSSKIKKYIREESVE